MINILGVRVVKTCAGCLEDGLRLLIDLFAVKSDVVIEVVVDLDASHRINNF